MSSQVYMALFSKSRGGPGGKGWDSASASAWCAEHGFASTKIEDLGGVIRVPQFDGGELSGSIEAIAKGISPGLKILVGERDETSPSDVEQLMEASRVRLHSRDDFIAGVRKRVERAGGDPANWRGTVEGESADAADRPGMVKYGLLSEVKKVDERTFDFVISDGEVDRDGDIIRVEGWDLRGFKANPVVLWAHDSSQPPIARAVSVGRSDGKLRARLEFPPPGTYPFADTVRNLVAGGFVNATSVGFRPLKYERMDSNDPMGGGIDFMKQELLEFSLVPIPANPRALIQASEAGVDLKPLTEWACRYLGLDREQVKCIAAQEVEGVKKALSERPFYVEIPRDKFWEGEKAPQAEGCLCGPIALELATLEADELEKLAAALREKGVAELLTPPAPAASPTPLPDEARALAAFEAFRAKMDAEIRERLGEKTPPEPEPESVELEEDEKDPDAIELDETEDSTDSIEVEDDDPEAIAAMAREIFEAAISAFRGDRHSADRRETADQGK